MVNSFEDIPEDREESHPCDCGGIVTLQPNGEWWECDECDFARSLTPNET